jgi:hypothetical protein
MQQLPFPPELEEIIAGHHRQLDHDSFRMVHLVQCADRLGDALGFGVLADAQVPSVEEALEHFPEGGRARLGDDHEQWKADITARLQAWH